MTPNPPPPPNPYPQGQPAPPPAYGPPPAYYPPQAYYPPPVYYPAPVMMAPVYARPPGEKTFEGLKWLRYGSLLAMATNALQVVGGLVAAVAIGSLNPNNPQFIAQALGTLFAVIILAVIAGILGFITLILGLLGLYNVHEGMHEFGEPHRKSIEGATKWFVIAAVAYISSGIASALLTVTAFTGGATPNNIAMSIALGGVVAGGILLLYVYAMAQLMQALVTNLMTAEGRGLRSPFLILSLAGGVAFLALRAAAGFLFLGALGNLDALTGVQSIASLAAGVSVLTAYLYYKQVTSAETGARNMIASGQFNPDAAAPGAPAPAVAPPT